MRKIVLAAALLVAAACDAPDAHWESNPTAYEITTRTVTSEDVLSLRLAPGGAAVSFLPE